MSYKDLIFKQLFESESSTYSYILADSDSLEAVIIDPVIETSARDIKLVQELGLNLLYIAETHVHADHITGAAKLSEAFPTAKKVVAEAAGLDCVDVQAKEGTELKFGRHSLKVIAVPGHTNGCLAYYLEHSGGQMVFTGDALLIRGCGRTDFQQGSAETLYNSVQKLFALPETCVVYPAHNYTGMMSSSIGEEKKWNPRLGGGKTVEQFVEIMMNLKLPHPKKIDIAVPANMLCGVIPAPAAQPGPSGAQ